MPYRGSFVPLAAVVAVLAGCGQGASPSAPGLPAEMPAARVFAAGAPARGTIEKLTKVGTITKKQMLGGLSGPIIAELGGKPRCQVTLYAMTYATIGVHGEPAVASAAFFVPESPCPGPFPLVGYSHGTNLAKVQMITNPASTNPDWTPPDSDPYVVAAIYGGQGYAVAATDYLGLGLSTYPYHPYLHADSEASAVIDSMRAARNAAKTLNVKLSRDVFLAGHSQGGQAAAATQRAIEAGPPGEFTLRGNSPSSGPYALAQTFQDSLRNQSEDAPILAAYTLTGYQKIYGNVYSTPTDVFKQPYATGIDSLLPVQTFKQEAALEGKTLPLLLSALLQPSFVSSFLNDPANPALRDAVKNGLLDGWTPKAPLHLCGGDRDPEVEYKNAKLALAYFTRRGAHVDLTDVNAYIPSNVPITDYHVVVADFCLPFMRSLFFDRYLPSARRT
jgi:pimeloyl-ACP methyl ester carboxylesterase